MAYKALDSAQSALVNEWLDQQGLSTVVRCQVWETFEHFAKQEDKPVFEVFKARAPAMSRTSEPKGANNADHSLGALYLNELDNDTTKGFMAAFFEGASDTGTLSATDCYAVYFGPVEALPPHLRSERVEFLNSPAHRAQLLAYHVNAGSIKDTNDLDEVAAFLKAQAKKTQSSIAQLGQGF